MGEIFKVILICAILGMLLYIGIMWVSRRKYNKKVKVAVEGQSVVDEETKAKRKKRKMFLFAMLLGVVGLVMYAHIKNRKK